MIKNRGVVSLTAFLIAVMILTVGCVSQYVRSAKIYVQQGDNKNAKEELLKGKDVTPNDPQLFHLLGRVHAELEEWEEMNVAFNHVMELTDSFNDDIEATRKESWRMVFNKGVKPFNKEDYSKALVSFKNALIIIPGKYETLKQLGLCYLQLENTEKAEEYLKAAIETESDMTTKNADDPKYDLSSRINLLNIYMLGKRWDEVISIAQDILEHEPGRADVIDKIALAYQQTDQDEKAIKAWDDVIKVNPENPDYYYNKGNILYRMERLEEAAEAYKSTLKYKPDDEEAFALLTNALLRLEDWQGLVELLEPALFQGGAVEAPENPEKDVNIWRILNAAYVNIGENEKALVTSKVIITLEGDSP
ncbi:MAG: tetratricopeptide repeat protein [Candidatus Electryonea clarkiae]|nr:tetratricopeptide repeat protein [Candidatus Electryonea clarkiae]MDP8287947.1 tetratricopeptide repeat protein [Candidatus Electryonea clarkiae]